MKLHFEDENQYRCHRVLSLGQKVRDLVLEIAVLCLRRMVRTLNNNCREDNNYLKIIRESDERIQERAYYRGASLLLHQLQLTFDLKRVSESQASLSVYQKCCKIIIVTSICSFSTTITRNFDIPLQLR